MLGICVRPWPKSSESILLVEGVEGKLLNVIACASPVRQERREWKQILLIYFLKNKIETMKKRFADLVPHVPTGEKRRNFKE